MSSTTYNIEWQEYPEATDAIVLSAYDVCWSQNSGQNIEYSFPVVVYYTDGSAKIWPGSSILDYYTPYTTIPSTPTTINNEQASVLSYPVSENIKNDLIKINGEEKTINYKLYVESSTEFAYINDSLDIKGVKLYIGSLNFGTAESPNAELRWLSSSAWERYWPGPNDSDKTSTGEHHYTTGSNIFVTADGSPNFKTSWKHFSTANWQKRSFHTNYLNTLNRAIKIKGNLAAYGFYNNSLYDYAAANPFAINGIPLTLGPAVNGQHSFEVTIPINNNLTINDTKYPINLSWTGIDDNKFSCVSQYYSGQGLCVFLELKNQSNSSSDYVEYLNLDFNTPNNQQSSLTQQLYAIDWEITELKYK